MDEQFDPAALDWSRHRLGPADAELGPGIFLADYAQILGAAIHEGWSAEEPGWIRPPGGPEPELPEAEVAFHDPRRPVAEVHETYGPAVRTVLSPSAWRAIGLRLRDGTAWERSFRRDPADGSLVPALLLRSRQGKDAREPITRRNWNAAWEFATIDRLSRRYAIDAMKRIALGVALMARAGDIVVMARPIGGGRPTPLPLDVWDSGAEGRLRILAACGVDLAGPDRTASPPTHLLFVSGDDPAGAAKAYGDANYVCAYPEHGRLTSDDDFVEDDVVEDDDAADEAIAVPVADPDAMGTEEEFEKRVADFLWTAMLSFGGDNWRQTDLIALVDERFALQVDEVGEIDDIVERVRKDLLAHEEGGERKFAFLSRSGQPPKVGRPSTMNSGELSELVRSIEARVQPIRRTA